MGLTLSNPATTVNSKLDITKSDTAGQSYFSVSVTAPNGAASAWVQATASAASDLVITGAGYLGTGSGTATGCSLNVAIGGSGSESTLSSIPVLAGAQGWAPIPIGQRIAAGQRIAVKMTQLTSFGGDWAFTLYLAYVPYANLEGN